MSNGSGENEGPGRMGRREVGAAVWRLRARRRQRGTMLLEVLVAIFVFGLVGAAVLSGMSATAMSGRAYEVSSNIENIARNQMEHMNSLPYVEPGNSYHTIAVPEGYAVTCEATEYVAGNPAIEKVVVTVSVEGTVRLVVSTIRTR